ncbi:methylmalonic aciduria type A protein, mitochondrial isoform X1 [Dermacentor silvarum]|uniref:methylmalonic aciduria type A protein, mitochondrial isoform X1 n=1 Tax=Dermacentor silvarum TaxID=543639 RepID=UPI00189B4DD8|nr:methylmalonic aciduria type A protein, mitochondrial isoform X1 [Dermacentor silvarum]
MLVVQVTSRVLRFMPKPLCQLHTKRGSCVSAATEAIESERIRKLFDGLTAGDRASLAQSITLVESTARKDHDEAQELLQLVLQENKGRRKALQLGSFRIGLTGPPGTGKSTFIETFGKFLTGSGHKVAVLTVDPSSAVTGGSLLGDKTRMIQLTRDPNAYIRPSPTRGHGGGVTRTTCDAIQLCECAGYDVVLVETVGVGQSEYMVADMVDLFLLLIPPGGGDELQGVKRGIVEMADLIAVTKADGDNIPECRRMAAEYVSALKFMKPRSHLWRPKVLQVSAKANVGISELWDVVQNYRDALEPTGELGNRRQQQRVRWLWTYVGSELERQLRSHPGIAACTAELENAVIEEAITPGHACDQLISHFFKGNS